MFIIDRVIQSIEREFDHWNKKRREEDDHSSKNGEMF